MVYSASAAYDLAESRLMRHLVFVAIGLVAMVLGAQFDYHYFQGAFVFRFLALLSITLLVAVLIPGIGVVRSGAQRWIEVGNIGFQPSEIAKFALLVLLAVKLSQNQDELKSFKRGFVPYVAIILTFATLIFLERDLGTPVVLSVSAFLVLLIAGAPWYYLIPSIAPGVAAVYFFSVTSDYRYRRLTAFLDPWSHSQEEGYQLIQSMTAFVNGSIWGVGPGASQQKLYYLPEAHTDFVFAIWGEEAGMVGALLLVALFALLVYLAMRIALNSDTLFGTLLASGIVSLIGFQAAFNMAVATGLLPTKGLPLPFISMGGTSLIVFMGLMGIVINIGLQARPPVRAAQIAPAH